MPVHRVELSLPSTDIESSDVVVSVWSDNEMLGELRVSRGTIDWRPGHHRADAWNAACVRPHSPEFRP